MTEDLSSDVDTSYGNPINAGTGQYLTGTVVSNTGNSMVPFLVANAGPATLAITGLNVANVITTAYTLINSTFGAAGDNRPPLRSKAPAEAA